LTVNRARELALPEHDFWRFDDRLVAVLRLGDTGVDAVDLIDEPEAVGGYRAAQRLAVGAAVPCREWAR
jgi:hypothetical protein